MTDTNDNEGLPGLPAAIDTGAQDLDKLAGLPLRAQQIGALLASGFSPADIDRAFQLPETTAAQYRKKYFTNRSVDISPQTRDKIVSAYLRAKAIGLVSHITPHKMERAGLGELSKSASMLLARAADMEGHGQVQDIGARISSALSKLAQVTAAQRDARKIAEGERVRDNENEESK